MGRLTDWDKIATEAGWVRLRRGWYHPFATAYIGWEFEFRCFKAAREAVEYQQFVGNEMARKIKTITLEFPVTLFGENKGVEAYRITKVTDSVEYSPGKCIERKEVDSLCDHPEWKVTIVPNPNK